jgi:hypothetical protein
MPLGPALDVSGLLRTLPGNVKARFDGLSSLIWSELVETSGLESRRSPSPGITAVAGLAEAVAVCVDVFPRLARLVTLAGLISDLSSVLIGLGIDIELATADMAPLMLVVATGASEGLLIPIPPPAMRDDRTL